MAAEPLGCRSITRLAPLVAVVALLLVPVCSQAQTPLGSQTLSLTLQNAVKISVPSSAALTHSGTAFADYTANGVSISYWIRTSSGGSGNIQVQATSDFSCVAGGPCIATPPTAGDALTYTCSGATLGTNCSGSQTVSTTAQTNAVTGIGGGACTGGGGACSSAIPNTGTLNLTLTNDPKYPTGSYSAVLTFTISAT